MKKQLSEKRKQELRDQLTKARSKKKTAEYKNVHPSVLAKPDDDPLSFVTIKKWIKHNKEKASALLSHSRRRNISSKESTTQRSEGENAKAYVRFMEHYLKMGDWVSNFQDNVP